MRKFILLVCVLLNLSGCDKDRNTYPKRPKDTPYFYNETGLTEVNVDICTELRRARKLTGIEFVVVLLKRVPQDIRIEEYAAGLFDEWKIGSKAGGKGLLVLFVEDSHTLKIEVGYALEGIFTDAFCASFQPTIKSYYAGRYFGDVFTGMIMWMETKIINGTEAEFDDELKNLFAQPEAPELSDTFLSGGGGIVDDEYFFEKETKLSLIRQIPVEKIRQFDSEKDVEVVLERYFRTLEEGINYPFLGIFTEGSQMMRLEYPKSIHYLQSEWADYQRQFPYRIAYNNKKDLAALRFKESLVWPIFLRETPDGYWKLDVTKAWAYSQSDADLRRMYPRYKDHPWMFAFSEYKYQRSRCWIPELIPFPLNLREKIAGLEEAIKKEPVNASNYFELADIFYWECYWIRSAIDVAEEGLELEPDNVPYRWLAIDMRYRFPEVENTPIHYEALLKSDPEVRRVRSSYSWHCWFISMEYRKALSLLKENKHESWAQQLLRAYKKNYWEQVARDKHMISKTWGYFYIFYLPHTVTSILVAISVVGLAALIIIRKRLARTQNQQGMITNVEKVG